MFRLVAVLVCAGALLAAAAPDAPPSRKSASDSDKALKEASPTRSTSRSADTVEPLSIPKWERQLRIALEQPITLEFAEAPFAQVVDALRQELNVPILFDLHSLRDLGIDPQRATSSIRVRNVSAKSALNILLRPLDLEWDLQNEVLVITTIDAASMSLTTRVYPVGHLLMDVDPVLGEYVEESSDSLLEAITSTVDPSSWDALGGPGAIQPLWSGKDAVLIVLQTRSVHEKIVRLLGDLKQARRNGEPRREASGEEPVSKKPTPEEGEPVQATALPDVETIVAANNEFACDLYGNLSKAKGNAAFSPLSITSAMGMVYAGARNETAEEIATVMRFPADHHQLHPRLGSLQKALLTGSAKRGPRLSIANRLWVDGNYRFLDSFKSLCEIHYDAVAKEIDFSDPVTAGQEMNAWIEAQTEGKISDLVSPEAIDPQLTKLFLVNAIYFEGEWRHPFEESQTEATPFDGIDGQIETPMMSRLIDDCRYARVGAIEVVELPYVNSSLAMTIILPPSGTGPFQQLSESLTPKNIAMWHKRLRPQSVKVSLPRFKVAADVPLESMLKERGMMRAFSRERGMADFSGFDGTDILFLTAALHRTVVEVDEVGTKAAAVTAFGGGGFGTPPKPIQFLADHPFVFLIRDTRTGCILFMGKVEEPERAGEAAEKPSG